MKRNKFFVYTVIFIGLILVADSCASTGKKGCGCGTDINRVGIGGRRYR
jgi:hypothetical protein